MGGRTFGADCGSDLDLDLGVAGGGGLDTGDGLIRVLGAGLGAGLAGGSRTCLISSI